jgi:hypothetical protein
MIIEAKRPVREERELMMLEVSIDKVDNTIIYARVTFIMPLMG